MDHRRRGCRSMRRALFSRVREKVVSRRNIFVNYFRGLVIRVPIWMIFGCKLPKCSPNFFQTCRLRNTQNGVWIHQIVVFSPNSPWPPR